MHKTYQEIIAQYDALLKTYDYIISRKDEIKSFITEKNPKTVIFAGCGSGYCLCQSGAMSMALRTGIASYALAAGDLMLNSASYCNITDNSLLIAPSRSGSTTEVVEAVKHLKDTKGTPIISISCKENSDLSKIADLSLEIPWAYDESVCQTRTVSNLYMVNLLISAFVSDNEGLIEDIKAIIENGPDFLESCELTLKELASQDWNDIVLLADGELGGIAAEGAIAFTEIAKIAGRYYHVLDVRHGPMVLVNEKSLVLVHLTDNDYPVQKKLVEDILNRGAKVITYCTDSEKPSIDGVSAHFAAPKSNIDIAATGIPFINIAQLLAYYKANHLGINPDNPDGIVSWVKL